MYTRFGEKILQTTFLGDTNKSHLFGRFICHSWCHSIFHPGNRLYVCLGRTQVSSRSKCDKHNLQGVNSWRKCHVFDINLWWTLSKSRSPWTPGYKPATIGRNQCYEQNGCCTFAPFNRKAATSENCPPNHLNWYSTTGQWCCKRLQKHVNVAKACKSYRVQTTKLSLYCGKRSHVSHNHAADRINPTRSNQNSKTNNSKWVSSSTEVVIIETDTGLYLRQSFILYNLEQPWNQKKQNILKFGTDFSISLP